VLPKVSALFFEEIKGVKEIKDIIAAYKIAVQAGKKTALATVVKVEGSSYRQPGARMLVSEDGELTGAISGGCLEGDALRKALLSINQQQNKLITYDTSNDDDLEFGVQLGCNGIVHILFEYINDDLVNNPITLLQQLETERKEAVIVTVFSLIRNTEQLGTILFYKEGISITPNNNPNQLILEVSTAINNKVSLLKKVAINDIEYEALIQYVAPPVLLIIAGAGNDVKPVVEFASVLGWEVTVADGRATHATTQRFSSVKKVMVVKPKELVDSIIIDTNTFFVLMTHNYKYDLAMLTLLLETDCKYIGILGPKTKLNRMIEELNSKGIKVTDEQLQRIYGPVGLDIGAETSEEIALSIIAEIKTVISGRKVASLKYKEEKIHTATPVI
jgi:xanthine dehydrogenase accessory factor